MSGVDIKKIRSLARRDPLTFGITYVDLLEENEWEVETRAWIKEIYSVVNPWLIEKYPAGQARQAAFQKPTQVGLSTMGLVRMLHLTANWAVRIGYSLPRQKDVIDFVGTRINPMIKRSPYLASLLGDPDSTYTKKFGNSYIFMMEASVEPRMMPMDALFRDEIDLSDQENLGMMMNRMDASKWKLVYDFSTPTIPNFGINKYFEQSDKREWMVPCPHCAYWQELDWEHNLKIEGPNHRPKNVEYVCQKCGKELTLHDIQNGEWVPHFPDRSHEIVGFHISQMMTHPASALYAAFIDPQTSIKEFYRKRLGIAYSLEGGQLTRDDFLVNCFTEPYEAESYPAEDWSYYMGVDQGNELQAVIGKKRRDSRQIKVVHVELIPPEKGFSRVGQLMNLYKIKRCVADGDPNRHPLRELQKTFHSRLLIADYAEIKRRWETKTKPKTRIKERVVINRTENFDNLMESVSDGLWALPGVPPNLDPDVELIIAHMTSLRRDTEERKKAGGTIEVGVWRPLRADHLAHAMGYLKVAADIDGVSGFRSARLGDQTNKEDEDEEEYDPSVEIWALLSECPRPQLQEYIEKREQEEYSLPFPLSYKLPMALENNTVEQIVETLRKKLAEFLD